MSESDDRPADAVREPGPLERIARDAAAGGAPASEPDERPTDEGGEQGPRERVASDAAEGGDPGSVGSLDGAAAAGGTGAVSGGKPGSLIPQQAPDPSIGPD
jgi:hypothetical protein